MHVHKYLSSLKSILGCRKRAMWQSWGLLWGSLKLTADCTPEQAFPAVQEAAGLVTEIPGAFLLWKDTRLSFSKNVWPLHEICFLSVYQGSFTEVNSQVVYLICMYRKSGLDADIAFADYTAGVLPTSRKTDFGNMSIQNMHNRQNYQKLICFQEYLAECNTWGYVIDSKVSNKYNLFSSSFFLIKRTVYVMKVNLAGDLQSLHRVRK